ncbi:MlaD family protein [Nocardia sp. NBC_00511]|uniref:MlaD family protein n=1 Tax=Nocardia sp. NBC_00511 TaxID=2903591 RepID=UPI0030E06A75
MPAYAMPGVATSPRRARITGVVMVLLVLASLVAWRGTEAARQPHLLRIDLRTSRIGDGIKAGAPVSLHGVRVGSVTGITSLATGRQLVSLALDPAELFGLTDSFDIDYAPANLFGISEVALKGRGGGAPLRDGSIVELTGAGRVTDVTMGNLLRSVSAGTTRVLTPELTELLTHAGADMAAFTPLLRAMVTVAEAVADTQHYPSAFLIDQYASFIDGVGKFADGTVRLVHETYNMQVFRTDRARFDIGVSLVVDRLFPGIAALGLSAKQSLQGYTDSAAVLVDQLARMVPDPALVTADFTELLDRLDRSFRDGPNGPALALDVTLRGVPGVAVPLLGGRPLPGTTSEGGR